MLLHSCFVHVSFALILSAFFHEKIIHIQAPITNVFFSSSSPIKIYRPETIPNSQLVLFSGLRHRHRPGCLCLRMIFSIVVKLDIISSWLI